MIKDLVSIIITTYNRPIWLDQAIHSVLGQTYPSLEIIIVDDGSSENKADAIKAKFPSVNYYFLSHQGPGGARNSGFNLSKGEFIQFLDDDDWLDSRSIEAKKSVLDRDETAGAVYSDIYLADEQGRRLGRYFKGWPRPLPSGDIYPQLVRRNFIPIHALLWRREMFEKAGKFPVRFGHEDWECILRTSELTGFANIDQPLAYYRQHRRSLTHHFDTMYTGKLVPQQYIATSDRFQQLARRDRIALLCKFAFQQWGYGDIALAKQFLGMAREADRSSRLPFLVDLSTKFGRRTIQAVIRLLAIVKGQ